MGTTLTTHYSWIKPNPFEEIDIWGGELNSNLDAQDAKVFAVETTANNALAASAAALPKSGGTMTGAIVLAADGAAALQPASYGQMTTQLALKGNLVGNNVWTVTNEAWMTTQAGSGPYLDAIWRPAAPANLGVASVRRTLARNTTNSADIVFAQEATITQDVTPGSESAVVQFQTIRGGALDIRASLGRGLFMKNNTTDPGDGNIAATSFVEGGVALSAKYETKGIVPNNNYTGATHTITPADVGCMVTNNAVPMTVTFNDNVAVPIATNARIDFMVWAGALTFAGGAANSQIYSAGNVFTMTKSWAGATAYHLGGGVWIIMGNLG